jgi:hypothetical protein
MVESNDTLAEIDREIAALLAEVSALRRARQILATRNRGTVVKPILDTNGTGSTRAINHPQMKGSVGSLMMDILTETGKAMTISELLKGINAKAGKNIRSQHLSTKLSQYLQRGKIRRVSAGVYALPKG